MKKQSEAKSKKMGKNVFKMANDIRYTNVNSFQSEEFIRDSQQKKNDDKNEAPHKGAHTGKVKVEGGRGIKIREKEGERGTESTGFSPLVKENRPCPFGKKKEAMGNRRNQTEGSLVQRMPTTEEGG